LDAKKMIDPILVFTDLDGALLDYRTYSFEPARPALLRLRQSGIPVIICTSKTRAEVEAVRAELGNSDPFIVENGGAVFIPENYFSLEFPEARKDSSYLVLELGSSYSRILDVFSRMKKRLPVGLRGFSDMTVDEVARLTGLSQDEAVRAKKREYDEPFLLDDPAANLDIVRELAESAGLSITRGRFFHLTGDNDKGKAVRAIKDIYARKDGVVPRTIGLGDSPNDLSLLENVDFPVLVQRPGGRYEPSIRLDGLILAPGEGPIGWSMAVRDLVDRLTG
jgi:mannosyl-3-phosphoglycerate phosphatase